jgi:hypothetical protein
MQTISTVLIVIATVLMVFSFFPLFGLLAWFILFLSIVLIIVSAFAGLKNIGAAIFFLIYAIIRLIGGGVIGI